MAIISAGTQLASSGTAVFSNSNEVTFGMSNSSIITASFNDIRSISAGNTSNSFSGITFSNLNNVSFGLNAGVITASASTVNGSYTQFPNGPWTTGTLGMNTNAAAMTLGRFWQSFPMSATRFDYFASLNVAGSQGSSTFSIGIFTRSGSTVGSASSTAVTASWDATTTASATNNYGGQSDWRNRSLPIGTWNMTPGEYWMGFIHVGSGTGGSSQITMNALASISKAASDVQAPQLSLIQISGVRGGAQSNFAVTFNLGAAFNYAQAMPFPVFRLFGSH